MTKDELISKQQIQIEEYKQMLDENTELKRHLQMKFYAIGQPLNDKQI
jgi:SMC interacting uncharacterized protein involved in chromosome segregation